MTTEQIAAWLRTQRPAWRGRVFAGCLDANGGPCIGVYRDERAGGLPPVCIGGAETTRAVSAPFSFLIHWTESPLEAEQEAQALIDILRGVSCTHIGGGLVYFIDPGKAPGKTGRDGRGACEILIKTIFYYERSGADD